MKKLKKADFFILAVILLIIAAIVFFTVRRPGKDSAPAVIENTSGTPREVKYSDYDGKKIGILTGTSFEDPTLKYFPNADYLYYNSTTDITQALREGMIDGFVNDEPLLRILNSQQHDIDYIREKLNTENYAFGFTKNDARVDKIRNEFNEFLKGIKADGTLKELNEIWFGDDESKKVVDFSGLSGKKLNVVTTALDEPFSYYKENQIVGMAIKLVELFCRQYGYEPHIENVDYSARVPGLVSNRYDMCAGPFTVTEERKESINFSDVVYEGGICLAVRAADLKGTLNSGAVTEKKVTYSDYNGKKIGIITGTNFEPPTFKFFPDSEYLYFNGNTDIIEALRTKKIDGFILDEPVLRVLSSEQSDISYIKEKLADDNYAFGFTKNDERVDAIRNEFNEFLKTIKADGTLQELNDIWFGDDESKKVVDLTGFSGKNLNVVTTALEVPFTYYKDNKLVGLTINLVEMFCRKYGYVPNIEDVDYSARVPGLVSGRYDMCAGAFTITEERLESINFSDVIYEGGICLAVRTEDLVGETAGNPAADTGNSFDTVEEEGFFEGIASSFNKNFIREDRWKLILEGVGTTCAITALTVLFGTILAFLICMFRRIDSILANKICNLYVKLLQGTPILVLLMILYYVVFGKSGLEAIWVAVIGFSLNLGAFGSEIMRSGIEGVDPGQREAALALGYTENQAFFKFIFPQASLRFLPVYRGEIISLLKNTSIVGYIAIQDLTKMSDIIRSRTFEAFFPLIVTAVIYFILAWIISMILARLLILIDPRRKKKGVKGVAVK